jgi:hypothetical protein
MKILYLLLAEVQFDFPWLLTPKALANSSPVVGAERQPWE